MNYIFCTGQTLPGVVYTARSGLSTATRWASKPASIHACDQIRVDRSMGQQPTKTLPRVLEDHTVHALAVRPPSSVTQLEWKSSRACGDEAGSPLAFG
jgi:hypothetical protein